MTNLPDSPTRAGVLIVGTGEAGVRVAVALREFGYDRPIVLVGDEPYQPYQRPPLSKAFLDGSVDDAELTLRTPDFYRDRGIDVRCGQQVTHLNVDESGTGTASCDSAEQIAFDHLVLATGARARRLPTAGADLDGVCTLRNLDDAVALRERLNTAERVIVLGGGYIGLETAAMTSSRGLATTVVEQKNRLLSRVSSAPMSEFLQNQHRSWGVEFALGAEVRDLAGAEGRVRGARLTDGTVLPADLVIAGIGAVPETTLAEKLGLEVRRGIVVDTACRTSHPHVLAAGDCTVQPHPHLPGRLIGMESVQNANDQAKIAAATITGVEPSHPVPWFWSDQRDLKLQIAGITDGHDQHVVRGSLDSNKITILYYRDGTLIAAEAVNRPKDYMAVKRALGKGQTIAPETAVDPEVPLKEHLTASEREK